MVTEPDYYDVTVAHFSHNASPLPFYQMEIIFKQIYLTHD